MISAHREALSTTPELLVSSVGATAAVPKTVILGSASAADCYIGGPGVDSASGFSVPQSPNTLTLLLGPGDDLYAVAGSGTPTIAVFVTRENVDKG